MKKIFGSVLRGSFILLYVLSFLIPTQSASALTTLSVTPITWNVIGLDSNNVNVGPNHFPVGARVCNTGAETATNVTAAFVWDTVDPYIDLRPGTLTSINLGTLNASACADAYFEVEVDRDSNAYDHTRRYHIDVTAVNVTGTTSTPTPREVYVERLISQSRNGITDMQLNGVSIAPGGTMNLMVGQTYTIKLVGNTATQGYEQIEYFINFPNTIFQIVSVSSAFTADTSATVGPSPINKLYGDNCVWENDPTSPNYRACLSTGKTGGNIEVTYQVKILQVPGAPLVNPEPLSSLIYDFSGSSYHYNADYDVSTRYANIINASIEKSFSPKTIIPGANSTLTFTVKNPGPASINDFNFTDDLPSNLNLANANVTYSGCGVSPSPTSGSLTDPLSFSNITVAGNGTCTITVTSTSNTPGTYNNTTSTLKIGTTDTLDTGSDTLIVSSQPAPPSSCTTRTTMATWSFENYSGLVDTTTDGGPFNASSDLLPTTTPQGVYRSAGSSVSAIIDRDMATLPTGWAIPDADNATTVWGIRQSWLNPAPASPFNPSTFTSPFFEFQVNTEGLYGGLGISMDYNLESASGWTNGSTWYILYSTDGSSWSQPQSLPGPTLNGTGSWTKGNWFGPAIPNISAISNSTSTNVYFRLYFVGAASGGNNSNANAYIDNVVVSGCPTPPVPTISKSFSPTSIGTGSTSTLTINVSNTASGSSALTGVSFTDVLPGGLVVNSPSGLTNTCGGTATATAGTSTISLSGGTLAAAASCAITVSVKGNAAGSYTNTTTNITSTQSGPNTSTTPNVGFGQASLTVINPPVINKAFTANPIFTGNSTALSFSINNPNAATTLTGVNFTDTLPAGLAVATPNGLSGTCGGGTITATGGSGTISLSGASLAAGATCTFSVNVTGTTTGLKTNSVTVGSTNGGAGNTSTADVLVKTPAPAINVLKSVSSSNSGPWTPSLNVTLPGSVYYRLIVENVGDLPLSSVSVSDPNVSTAGCSWVDGDGTVLGAAPISLPVADAADNQLAICILGPVTALDGTNPNTATASGTNGSTVTDTSTATYTGLAPNLTLAKTDGVTTVTAGGTTTYTLTVTNSGTLATSGTITVVDVLPTGMTISDGAVTLGGAQSANWACNAASNVITCTSSAVIAATSGTSIFSFPVNISTSATGTLVNKAKVGGGGDPTNSTAPDSTTTAACTATGTPEGCALDSNGLNALTIDKDTSTPSAFIGGTATYTVVVTNTGTTTLTGAVISDTLPTGFTYASTGTIATTGAGTTRTATNDPTNGSATPSWDTWTIVSGGSVTIPFTVNIGGGVTAGTYDNTARVVTTEIPGPIDDDGTVAGDPGTPGVGADPENDEDVTVTAVADLRLTKTVNNATPNIGSNITFTVTVFNDGPSNATGVVVGDLLPAGYTYVSDTASQGTYVSGTGVWTVGAINNGASANIQIVATVGATGPYANTAQVTASNQNDPDSTPNNNLPAEDDQATVTPVPVAVADLRLTKTVNNATPNIGSNVTFTVTVFNDGPSNATGVVVGDLLPAGYTYVSDTASQGTYVSGTGVWTVGAINNGASANIQITATVGATGPYANTAQVTASNQNDPDSTPNNNLPAEDDQATVTPVPVAVADLRLTKTVNNATPNIGSNVTFTVTVFNDGPSNATGVVVGDLLPAGYTYVLDTASQGTYVSGTGVWTVGAINNGASANIQITATVGATGPYANTAQVTASNQNDPDSTPNNNLPAEDDQATVTPVPVAASAPSISKAFSPNPINVNGVSTLTFTITNPNAGTALTGVAFTDTFPAGMQVAATPNATTTGCGAPTFAPAAGNTSLSFSGGAIAASGSCTVTVDVTATTGGSKVNTTGNVTSTNGGTGNTGTDTLQVNVPVDLQVTKTDGVTSFIAGGNLTYTIRVFNAGPNNVTGATLSDVRPAEFSSWSWTCAATGAGSSCGTPANGTGDITVTGINLPADAGGLTNFLTYTVNATVSGTTAATTITNTVIVTEPTGTVDTVPVNNQAVDANGQIFDPPSAFKTFTAIGGIPVLEFRMVWINNGNAAAINVQVTDNIPVGTTYVPGTITCTPLLGSSTAVAATAPLNTNAAQVLPSTSCGFDSTANRVQWQGTIAPDPGVLNDANSEANASNEVIITFQVTVDAGINDVSNVGTSRTDADNNGDFTSQADVIGSTLVNSNLVLWNRGAVGSGGEGGATTEDRVVLPTALPATGFAPNRVTVLPEQPAEKMYSNTDVWLEVPRLGLKLPIVGVPLADEDWDVSWLWKEAGWLEGTAFPSWQGNSVLTSHITLANGEKGPFAELGKLKYGDRIIVHAYGESFIYEVRQNRTVKPNNTSVLQHEDKAWLTLLTCKTYNEATDTYADRIAVRAVLIDSAEDKTPSGANVR